MYYKNYMLKLIKSNKNIPFDVQFGHALHSLLTTVEYSDISGLSFVEWDAVFISDFFMENWYK